MVDTSRKTQVAPTPQSLSLVQGPPDPKKQDEKIVYEGGECVLYEKRRKNREYISLYLFVLMLHKACQEHMKGGYKMLLIN